MSRLNKPGAVGLYTTDAVNQSTDPKDTPIGSHAKDKENTSIDFETACDLSKSVSTISLGGKKFFTLPDRSEKIPEEIYNRIVAQNGFRRGEAIINTAFTPAICSYKTSFEERLLEEEFRQAARREQLFNELSLNKPSADFQPVTMCVTKPDSKTDNHRFLSMYEEYSKPAPWQITPFDLDPLLPEPLLTHSAPESSEFEKHMSVMMAPQKYKTKQGGGKKKVKVSPLLKSLIKKVTP